MILMKRLKCFNIKLRMISCMEGIFFESQKCFISRLIESLTVVNEPLTLMNLSANRDKRFNYYFRFHAVQKYQFGMGRTRPLGSIKYLKRRSLSKKTGSKLTLGGFMMNSFGQTWPFHSLLDLSLSRVSSWLGHMMVFPYLFTSDQDRIWVNIDILYLYLIIYKSL